MLMDGYGVASGADDRVLAVEAKFDRRVDPPVGAYGVPYAAEVDFDLAREGILEGVFGGECRLLAFRPLGHIRVEPENVGDQLFVAMFEQTVDMEEAPDSSGSVGAATETDQVDVIAGYVGIHQVAVGIPDVVEQAFAEGKTFYLRPPLGEASFLVGRSHGADAGVVVGNLTRPDEKCVVEL